MILLQEIHYNFKSNTLSLTCCIPLFGSVSCCSWLPVNTDLPWLEGFRESSGTLFGRASGLFLRIFLFLFRFLRRRLTGNSLNCNVSGKASSPSQFALSLEVGGVDSLVSESSEAEMVWLSWSQNTITLGLCLTIVIRSSELSSGVLTDFGMWSELLPSISDTTSTVPPPSG